MKLHQELLQLRKQEKALDIQIIDKLQLMEDGRKYLQLGYSTLFDYLVRGLGYSESAAYQKQSCIRLTREIPEIKQKISTGALTATGLGMAFKTLKTKSLSEKKQLLKKLENKPTRQIKSILQQHQPSPQIHVKQTQYSDKVVLRLELDKNQHAKLMRLKALRSHSDTLESLFIGMIERELKHYQNTHHKPTQSKNPRFISRTLRNHLLKKSNYQCQFPGCESNHFLQVDHKQPLATGGTSDPDNLQILCAHHNQWKGVQNFAK